MKLLTPLLLCFLCLLTGAKLYDETNLPGNRDHTGDGRTYTYSDTRVSNNGRNVKNVHSSFTDNSIHRNNANFEGASNVVIGNNKVPDGVSPQQTGAGPGNDRSSQGSGTQDYRNDGRTYTASDSRSGPNGNTRNVQTSYTDNTIRRDGANFDGARNVAIGHNQQLPSGTASQMNHNNRTQGQTNQPRYPRDTHIQQTDNSINLKDFQLHGSVQMIVGHGKRNKRNVTEQEAEEQGAGEEAASRQKRWGVGVKSNVRNEHSTWTDNSINMDNANFAGSQNVIIGHGNRASKRSVPVEEPQEGEELSRQKRWGVEVNSKVENTHSTRKDDSINMHNADFRRSANVVIGHGNKVSKRSLDAALQEDGTETEEKLLREKRWGVKVAESGELSSRQKRWGLIREGDNEYLTNGECNYMDGVIYENGRRLRNANFEEVKMANNWQRDMEQWARDFRRTGQEPARPWIPCFCSPISCQIVEN